MPIATMPLANSALLISPSPSESHSCSSCETLPHDSLIFLRSCSDTPITVPDAP